MEMGELILQEIRDHRLETQNSFREILQRTSVLETKVEELEKDNTAIEPRVRGLENKELRQTGFLAAVAIFFEPVTHFVMKKLGL